MASIFKPKSAGKLRAKHIGSAIGSSGSAISEKKKKILIMKVGGMCMMVFRFI